MTTTVPDNHSPDPKYLPLSTNPSELIGYATRVQTASKERLERISSAITSVIGDPVDSMMISTTGSDGRNENKIFDSIASNTELSLLYGAEMNEETAQSVMARVQETTSFIIANLDLKRMEEGSMSIYNKNPNLIFPTRIWDAYRLWGNKKMDAMAREMVSREIIHNPKMVPKFYDRLRSHVRVNKDGHYRIAGATNTQFNLDGNEFYYNPKERVEGVKTGPLRVIQYSLALGLMRKIRDLGSHPSFVNELPQNIPDRLDFLIDNNLTHMSKKQINELQYIYRFFLKMYHQMQYENFTAGTIAFHVDNDVLNDIKAMLSMLTDTFTDRLFK